jgi:hypothetical protein
MNYHHHHHHHHHHRQQNTQQACPEKGTTKTEAKSNQTKFAALAAVGLSTQVLLDCDTV